MKSAGNQFKTTKTTINDNEWCNLNVVRPKKLFLKSCSCCLCCFEIDGGIKDNVNKSDTTW